MTTNPHFKPYANMRELLERRAAETPAKTFLYDVRDGREWTYAEFDAAVNRTADMLAAQGVRRGDVVSLFLPNSAEYIIAYFACFKSGALAGPVNSLLKAEEAAYVVGNSKAKVLLYHSQFGETVEEMQKEVSSLVAAIEFDDEINANSNFAGANIARASSAAPHGEATTPDNSWRELALERDDEAIIIYTSGTTGKPKGCLLTHGNLLSNAQQIVDWMRFTPADRLLSVMPLFHMNAVMVTTVAALYAGASSVVSPRFSASRFWQIISDYEVTSFGSVATMLSMLLATYPEGVPAGLQTKQLRFAMCGSAPVPAEVLRRFEETFGCLVIEGYGLSESTVRATFNPPDARRRPGSCGQSIGCEIKIFDEDEREVGEGALGEIVLRGENIFKGYYENEAATERAFRGGWFHTGDVGYADAEGFFYIVDRMSDMIIRGGENIYPREIDELLYRHPAIAAAATIGMPDELYGEEVAAFVVLKEGHAAPAEELLEYCRAHLADFKCPKTIRFLAELPKGPTGKVLKRELTRRL
ncbi:MAG TPA: long-chain-fatty-acid--CoA ligase [Pyrinomonadaceae bacterium]|jgi:long-chain acyl-CoA synthetase|nr:long-chain-fatty-acid--CoA ligase [Pyrinomonadaceae bacterium]